MAYGRISAFTTGNIGISYRGAGVIGLVVIKARYTYGLRDLVDVEGYDGGVCIRAGSIQSRIRSRHQTVSLGRLLRSNALYVRAF